MLRLSKKLLFAIEAVVDIAYNAGPGPVRSSEISRRQGIPRRYLEQVLQQLVHHGILAGQRGPRGGYRLARERRRITVGEIIRIVRQLEGANDPASESGGSEIGQQVVRPIWLEIQQEMMERFDRMTVEELCERARNKGIKSEAAQVPDFSI
ncbi:RrF2 family transcriptional regulator [Ferruginivarius sediminum]|uniref:Rrf2 family transcriptional regulator n=1 Tax=Ferruginivarius sediminum TaxID=2661937 RepID=A0A369TDH5_9PROT|nr:Rrf2 family transcriptional regulator [Ferruginivarius sediminum]RDD63369.1 Rrf2 family transcriptional regulator [Ferruginivarius sediminum]